MESYCDPADECIVLIPALVQACLFDAQVSAAVGDVGVDDKYRLEGKPENRKMRLVRGDENGGQRQGSVRPSGTESLVRVMGGKVA